MIQIIRAEQTWDIRHQVLWPDMPLDYVKLPEDNAGVHLGYLANDRIVAVLSFFISDNTAQFRKFATIPEERGKGYGSHLMHRMIQILRSHGVRTFWCNARVDKTAFYSRFGLKPLGSSFSKKGILYSRMEGILEG